MREGATTWWAWRVDHLSRAAIAVAAAAAVELKSCGNAATLQGEAHTHTHPTHTPDTHTRYTHTQ